MNIIVRPYGSDPCYCRPDTTWERENRDLYSPECVNEWHWAPVLFARISKAGKCISPKFVSRYYDAVNFGALLYCNPEMGIAFASCADHTSLLPAPLYNPAVMGNEDNRFEVNREGVTIYSVDCNETNGLTALLEDSICKASQRISLRIGDFVAVELATPAILANRQDGEVELKADFCNNRIFDFKIIF